MRPIVDISAYSNKFVWYKFRPAKQKLAHTDYAEDIQYNAIF